MSIKYELIIYWSDEAAVANAQQVIQEWVDTAKELGRPVPEPKGRLMYV